MKQLKSITLLSGLFLFFTGCTGFLEPQMKGSTDLQQLISSQQGMFTAVNGMYKPLQPIYRGNMQLILELAGDDGWAWRNAPEADLFISEQDYSNIANVWQQHYLGIGRANVILDNLDNVTDFDSEQRKQDYEGQAKFMRAFYYFNLVRLYGGVPVILHQINQLEDAQVARSSMEDVYLQIEKDLDEAEHLLPAEYAGTAGSETGRPTTHAASALKTLVYLEICNWDKVIESADKIIDKGLLVDYDDNFNGTAENGKQVFFEVQYGGVTAATTTNLSTSFSPQVFSNGSAMILPTDDNLNGQGGGPSSGGGFVQLFDERPGDNRKDVIIQTYGLANFIKPDQPDGTLYYVNKYYNTVDADGLSSWNFPLIRYAEILLAKAEALNEKSYASDGEAFALINKLREKAGLPPLTSVQIPDREKFRNELMNERRIELAFECKRYFDLNRWGIVRQVIQKQLDFMKLKFPENKVITHPITGKPYYLYPIPATEFVNNAKLGEQNPGYK
ncbi:MAG: RagB/SusD family nutrient uptake outer membrane protein [Tannerella sp.]|jgi:hypothetical protein|nr:RagB/SusD family nutrient uptake outer membrane protein [Tannerella sp.]